MTPIGFHLSFPLMLLLPYLDCPTLKSRIVCGLTLALKFASCGLCPQNGFSPQNVMCPHSMSNTSTHTTKRNGRITFVKVGGAFLFCVSLCSSVTCFHHVPNAPPLFGYSRKFLPTFMSPQLLPQSWNEGSLNLQAILWIFIWKFEVPKRNVVTFPKRIPSQQLNLVLTQR